MTTPAPQPSGLSFLRDRSVLRRVAIVAVVSTVLGGLYGLLAPKWYRTSASVTPVGPQRGGGLASMLGAELGGLVNLGASGGGAEPPKIAAVLQSNAVADAAIEKLGLMVRYGASSREAARDSLWRHCDITTWTKPSLVSLSCEDKDPRFAAQLVTTLVEDGNKVFRRAGYSSATEEVRFLEGRVAELRAQAKETALRMREFQERHGLVDIDAQSRAVVSAYATLKGQRIAKQLELDYLRTFAASDEPSTRQIESQISTLDRNLEDLREERDQSGERPAGKRRGVGMFPSGKDVPALRSEFEGLYRDRRVAEASLVFALDRLESAKASEARDVSTFVVMDPATVPGRPSRPRPVPVAILTGLTGLVAAIAYERWRSQSPRAG